MDVFIAFDGNLDAVPFLEKSLEAWDKVRFATPNVIEVKPGKKFEIQSRVIADRLAKDAVYILADIDAVPEDKYVVANINKMIAVRPDFGMAFIRPIFDVGGRVRVIRKGLVEKWPEQHTITYDSEHGEAIVLTGKQVETWDEISYRKVPSPIEIVN